MNKKIMEAAGFKEEVKRVEAGACPFCHKAVDLNGFRDVVSRKEHLISGLCQSCQDEMFGTGGVE